MDAKELKPCPFCGGKAITHGGARHIHCGNEHCTMTNVWAKAETAELAAQCWNTRAHDSDAAQVPQGWKLVPIEPTETMVVNGFESWPDEFFSSPEDWEVFEKMSGCQQAAHKAKLCYRAMLAAAPAIPQAAGDAAQAPIDKQEALRLIKQLRGHSPIYDGAELVADIGPTHLEQEAASFIEQLLNAAPVASAAAAQSDEPRGYSKGTDQVWFANRNKTCQETTPEECNNCQSDSPYAFCSSPAQPEICNMCEQQYDPACEECHTGNADAVQPDERAED